MTDPFIRLSLFIVRRRWVVVTVWLGVIIVSTVALAPKANSVVKAGGAEVPGSESATAASLLASKFNVSAHAINVVYRSRTSTVADAAFKRAVMAGTRRLLQVPAVRSVHTFFDTRDPNLVSKDLHTTLASVDFNGSEEQASTAVPELRKKLQGLPIEHYITGGAAIDQDTLSASEEDLRRAEVVTIPIILILLLLVFRTLVAAAMPLILGACSVSVATALIFLIGSEIDTSVFALNVASMMGLALGIDFALIVTNRFREEIAGGADVEDAVASTMASAGRSITYSGTIVILSMLAMTLLMQRLTVVRSISLAVAVVVLVGLVAALTLLPAMLGILGHRIERLRVVPRLGQQEPGQEGLLYRLSHAIMDHPWAWLAAALLVLTAIAFPIRNIAVIGPSVRDLPPNTESVQGAQVLTKEFGPGPLAPIEIIVQARNNGVWNSTFLSALQRLNDAVAVDSRTQTVQSLVTVARSDGVSGSRFRTLTPSFFRSNRKRAAQAVQVVDLKGENSTAVVTVIPKYGEFDARQESLLRDLHQKIIPAIAPLRRYTVLVGGKEATFIDFRDAIYGRFPIVVVVSMAMVFIILMMFFQSVFLPLKAMVMNLVTILATYGALVLIFQDGFAMRLVGLSATSPLNVIIPPILFVILFALSTDYEVFMLSRVREIYLETRSNREAVALGLQRTAGVITAAGLILVGTFGSFASANVVIIKEIGLGLAIGVMLDSTVVRVVLVPAAMLLMGDLNWWMPGWLKKVVPELREAQAFAPAPAMTPALAAPAGHAFSADLHVAALPSSPEFAPGVMALHTEAIGTLRPVEGSIGTDIIVLPQTRALRIGRAPTNQLQLFVPSVSRHHARIDYLGDSYTLIDLGSLNGVFVNSQRIPPHHRVVLHEGDSIQIGAQPDLTFAFDLKQSA